MLVSEKSALLVPVIPMLVRLSDRLPGLVSVMVCVELLPST